jgi:CheY-like chemotaxis protein
MTEFDESKVIDVLLVEDDEGDVLMTREAFEYYKIHNRLHVVSDGEQALQFLHQTGPYADAPRPGLILLDVNLPRRSGLEVLAELKQDDELLVIPVIMLTTSRAEEDIVRSYSLHANAFITKPVDFEHFIDAIRQIDTFFLTLVKLPVSPLLEPGGQRSHRDAQQRAALYHVDIDPGQVVHADRGAALQDQVGRMAGNAVARGGHQPSYDHSPVPGLRHGDQLTLHRSVDLRQVQGDLGAPGLSHQADSSGHTRAWIGGGVQLARDGQRRRGGPLLLRSRRGADGDAPADQHDAGRRPQCDLPAPAVALLGDAALDEVGDLRLGGLVPSLDRLDTPEQRGHRRQLGQFGGTGRAVGEMILERLPVPLFEQAHRVGADVGVLAAHTGTPRSARTTRSARSA